MAYPCLLSNIPHCSTVLGEHACEFQDSGQTKFTLAALLAVGSFGPWTNFEPHILELNGFIFVSLRKEGGTQPLPGSINRRRDRNHKNTVHESREELRELQDALQSLIHSHPTLSALSPRKNYFAF